MGETVVNKRDISIDIVKGIGMIAVILGHMSLPEKAIDFIFTFHMPLFFLINGYFFKKKSFKQCIWQKFRSLIVPYLVTSILVIASSTFWSILRGEDISTIISTIKMWLAATLYGSGTYTHFLKWDIHIIGAIWFLLAMFWADIIFNLLLKIKGTYIWGILLAVIGYVTTEIIWLPTSLQAGLTAILFVEIGYIARRHDLLEFALNHMLVLIVAALLWGNSIVNGGHLYMVGNHYGNGIFDVLGAVSATVLLIKLGRLIAAKKSIVASALARYGKDSLIVLCFHLIELNTFPWYLISNQFGYVVSTLLIAILKISWSVLSIIVIKYIPVINTVFGKKSLVTVSTST